jgi:hypothetical protein
LLWLKIKKLGITGKTLTIKNGAFWFLLMLRAGAA